VNHADPLLTLREAVATVTAGTANGLNAGESAQISGPLGASDTIVFADTLLVDGPVTIALTDGGLPIGAACAIQGPGQNLLSIERAHSAATSFRIFTVFQNVIASITDLTIARGAPAVDDSGGAILNGGQLTVQGVAFAGNATIGTGNGGAIDNESVLNATNCRFTSNSSGFGGAIYTAVGSVSIIDNCTFDLNSANLGSAIYFNGSLTVRNSAFSDNATTANGGTLDFGNGGVGSIDNCSFDNNPNQTFTLPPPNLQPPAQSIVARAVGAGDVTLFKTTGANFAPSTAGSWPAAAASHLVDVSPGTSTETVSATWRRAMQPRENGTFRSRQKSAALLFRHGVPGPRLRASRGSTFKWATLTAMAKRTSSDAGCRLASGGRRYRMARSSRINSWPRGQTRLPGSI